MGRYGKGDDGKETLIQGKEREWNDDEAKRKVTGRGRKGKNGEGNSTLVKR